MSFDVACSEQVKRVFVVALGQFVPRLVDDSQRHRQKTSAPSVGAVAVVKSWTYVDVSRSFNYTNIFLSISSNWLKLFSVLVLKVTNSSNSALLLNSARFIPRLQQLFSAMDWLYRILKNLLK